MEQKKKLALDDSQIESVDNEVKTFELLSEKRICDQLVEQIMRIPAEIRCQFRYSIAAQSAGVKILKSGEIEVTPPKAQLLMDPVRDR